MVLFLLADDNQKYSLFVKVSSRLALAPVPDDIYVLASQRFVFGEQGVRDKDEYLMRCCQIFGKAVGGEG